METILNELSLKDLAEDKVGVREQIAQLLHLFGQLQKEYSFTKIRLPNDEVFAQDLVANYTLNDWLNDEQVNKLQKLQFLSVVVKPHFANLNEAAQNEYFNYDSYSLSAPETLFHEQECDGLVNAYLANTLAISFPSHPLWENCTLSLIRSLNEERENCQVHHASSENCLNEDFRTWINQRNHPPLNSHSEVDIWFPTESFSFSKEAKEDLIFFYQNGFHRLLEDIEVFLAEIRIHPLRGKGKPEVLKNTEGWMARRITKNHRLVYKIEDDLIIVERFRSHYGDK